MKEQQQLKHRIKAIENTRTITGAMQMVASSKLKKAQTMLENAALYQDKLGALLGRLAQSGLEHPYLQQRRQGKRVAYVVIGATSGLSGPYNGNLNRFARQVVENSPLSCEVWTVGSRPRGRGRAGLVGIHVDRNGWAITPQAFERVVFAFILA